MCVRDSVEWGIGVCVNKGGEVILDWERCCDELRNSCCRRDLSVAAGRRDFSTQAEKDLGDLGWGVHLSLRACQACQAWRHIVCSRRSRRAIRRLALPPPSNHCYLHHRHLRRCFQTRFVLSLQTRHSVTDPESWAQMLAFVVHPFVITGTLDSEKELQRSCGFWPVICSSKPHGSWTSKNGHWAFNTTWCHWDDFEIFIMARTILVQMLSFVHPFVKTRTADSKGTPNNLWWLTCNLVHKTSWLLDVQKTDI